MGITPIEEVPLRVSKFKRSRQVHQKTDEKLLKAYEESKTKILGKKQDKVQTVAKNVTRKGIKSRRMNSYDDNSIGKDNIAAGE